jgi:hypothetical protein
VWSGRHPLTFQRNISPLLSRSKNKPSKKRTRRKLQAERKMDMSKVGSSETSVKLYRFERDFSLSTASRLTGPRSLLSSGYRELFLPTGIKRPAREADHSPQYSVHDKNGELYFHPSIRLHGMLLNRSITGRILP